jgi:tripartite-type tricarboxylate transporter receptor subunit TctC
MKLPRRNFLHLAAVALALPALSRNASALEYPTRPVHIVVGFAAGINPDIIARLFAQSLSEQFKQQFIIDDRPGAASNIGTEAVVRAPPVPFLGVNQFRRVGCLGQPCEGGRSCWLRG